MREAFKKNIEKNLHYLIGKKILVACSGGLDSVVLATLMHNLNFEIALAHCNFSLRGKESDGDADFVADLAEKWNVPVFVETFDTKKYATDKKLSTQMAARELRYRWFEDLQESFGYDYVLTAHHADDDIETFLINLSRGTGLKGLTGIPQKNENIVRPLLNFSRKEILEYAQSNKLYWREDSSNKKTDYLRNKIRIDVIPNLKETSKSFLSGFQKTQDHLSESRKLIEDYMALVYNLVVTENFDGYNIHISKLKDLPNTGALLYELLSPFGFTDFQAMNDLMQAQPGKQLFSETHVLLKDRDILILRLLSSEEKEEEFLISEETKAIEIPISLRFSEVDTILKTEKNSIYVDKEKLDFPLKLRKWKDGDTFQPFGMKGKKKLSKFFKDEKLSLIAKKNVWLLCSSQKIVWVVGMRQAETSKVTGQTKKILKIAFKSSI